MLWIQSEKIKTALQHKQFDQARSMAQATQRSAPGKPAAWTDLAGVYVLIGDLAQAEQTLTKAIARFKQPFLYCFRAYVRHAGKQYDSALDDLREAERRAPHDISIQNNLAAALMDRERNEEAVAHLRKVLGKDPNHLDALSNLSSIYVKLKNYDDAIQMTRRRLKLDPDNADAYLALLNQLRSAGLLTQFQEAFDLGKTQSAFERVQRFETFHALTYVDDPAWHRRLAHQQARMVPVYSIARSADQPGEKQKLRIGYWSSDFHDHATVQLIGEVFELHDKTQFEIYLLSYGKPGASAARDRLERAADRFLDFFGVPDKTAVEQIAALNLDILVDLKGYTGTTRMAIPFARPAPVVISWLGYPGTLGTDKVDYIIGDAIVTPPGCEALYDEQIIRLSCYQPNDRTLVPAEPLSRSEYGLPEDAVVIAAFNATHKISPEIFDVWMRVLQRQPHTCLWLFAENEPIFRNLLSEAERRGVPANRIVHAGKRSRPEHIARYRAADLAVDCFPYGSHTTGSDALRSGCPLLALQGQSFASRVSASLLTAGGVPELITDNFTAYEDKLNQLAQSAPLREQLRERLKSVSQSPLFDTPARVAELEKLYQTLTPKPSL
jgi:predicted O-linked N-acetylglucosamine transferase (SPINDLY family)